MAPKLNTTADGSLYVSLRDMIAWDAGLRTRKVLKPSTWDQVFTAVSLNSGRTYPYGFGWDVANVNAHRAHRHGGSWQGFKSYIARYPDDDLTVIVLANLAQADPEKISDGVAAVIDATLAPAELKPIAERDEAMEVRVRRLLADAAAGKLSADEFAYVRAGFFPNAARAYAERLKDAGAVTGLTLLQKRELGDDWVYVYEVAFGARRMRLRLAVAPDRKLAAFSLIPG